MRRSHGAAWAVIAGLGLALGACGGADMAGGATDGSASAPSDGGAPVDASGTPDAPGQADGSTATDPSSVPAVPLEADPAVACPGAYGSTAPQAGLNTGFEVMGQSREFWLILPPAGTAGPRPLFVAFNGTGESGRSFSSRARLEDFAARGFIVAAPSSNMNGTVWPIWDDMRQAGDHGRPNADLAFFDTMIECLAGHLSIDTNRIYVGGHSAGGIMTNAVLQRRSGLIAGGIPASGVFDLTSPPDLDLLDEMFVLVTWGGPNDEYSGGVGVTVPEINFVEQASLASQFYEDEPRVGQANCSIVAGGGHMWLSPINDWMIDRLLEHPKGLPGSESLDLPPVSAPNIRCTEEPFIMEGGIQIECPSGSTAGCTEACQLTADCVAENSTVGPILEPQLAMIGFMGTSSTSCGGCVERCEEVATTEADADVLSCFANIQQTQMCGPGVEGAQPFIDAVNGCCEGRSDSPYCVELCRVIETSSVATSFFPTCESL